jgi:hypothetical protein
VGAARLVAALQGAHDVHDAFKDVLNLLVRQRPLVDAADVLEDDLFALGFVDWETAVVLEVADGDGGLSPLVDELDKPLVENVDLLTPIGNA